MISVFLYAGIAGRGRLTNRKLSEKGDSLSVENNKAVVQRFFEEVFNHKQPELIEEFLAEGVVDHNKIVFTEPDAPGGMAQGVRMLLVAFPNPGNPKASGCTRRLSPRAPRNGRYQHWFLPTGDRAYGATHRVGIDSSVPNGERQDS